MTVKKLMVLGNFFSVLFLITGFASAYTFNADWGVVYLGLTLLGILNSIIASSKAGMFLASFGSGIYGTIFFLALLTIF